MHNNKIKILHVLPKFATGGAERLVLHYARLFDPEHYEIHVASCVEDGELRKSFEKIPYIHVKLITKQSYGGRIGAYMKLAQYVQKIKPDIIHTHMISADLFGFFMKLRFRSNLVWIITMHNVEEATSYGRQWLWQHILRIADKVICVSKSVENFTLKYFNVTPKQASLVLNGVDLQTWLSVPLDELLVHDTLKIACVGRLWEQKGHIYLLDALQELDDIDCVVHMYGDGPLRHSLEEYAQRQNVSTKVYWHGIVSDVSKYVKDIDIIVQPSLWEGLSLVVMEMMAAARPVIATGPAGDELIQDKKNGFIIHTRDAHAIAKTIRYIANHREDVRNIAVEARTYAQKYFDIQTNVETLGHIYQQLML